MKIFNVILSDLHQWHFPTTPVASLPPLHQRQFVSPEPLASGPWKKTEITHVMLSKGQGLARRIIADAGSL